MGIAETGLAVESVGPAVIRQNIQIDPVQFQIFKGDFQDLPGGFSGGAGTMSLCTGADGIFGAAVFDFFQTDGAQVFIIFIDDGPVAAVLLLPCPADKGFAAVQGHGCGIKPKKAGNGGIRHPFQHSGGILGLVGLIVFRGILHPANIFIDAFNAESHKFYSFQKTSWLCTAGY